MEENGRRRFLFAASTVLLHVNVTPQSSSRGQLFRYSIVRTFHRFHPRYTITVWRKKLYGSGLAQKCCCCCCYRGRRCSRILKTRQQVYRITQYVHCMRLCTLEWLNEWQTLRGSLNRCIHCLRLRWSALLFSQSPSSFAEEFLVRNPRHSPTRNCRKSDSDNEQCCQTF